MFGIGASGLMDKLGWFYLLSNWLIYLMAVLGSSSIGYQTDENIQEGSWKQSWKIYNDR